MCCDMFVVSFTLPHPQFGRVVFPVHRSCDPEPAPEHAKPAPPSEYQKVGPPVQERKTTKMGTTSTLILKC